MKLLAPFGATLVIFILVPILITLANFSPSSLDQVLSNSYLRSQLYSAVWTTLIASLASVTILLITGIPLAYLLARSQFRGKGLVESILDLPMVVPHSVAGIMLLLAYASGPLGSVLRSISLNIVDSLWGTIFVMTFVGAPFMVNSVKRGFESVPRSAELVARSLGASKYKTFFSISIPMVRRHILTGVILSWARGVSEVGALLIVAYNPMTLSVLVLDWYRTLGLSYALGVTVLMLILSVAIFVLLRVIEGKNIDQSI